MNFSIADLRFKIIVGDWNPSPEAYRFSHRGIRDTSPCVDFTNEPISFSTRFSCKWQSTQIQSPMYLSDFTYYMERSSRLI